MDKINALIVEDEFIFAEVLTSFLTEKGLNVVDKTDNVKSALQIIKEKNVNFVILDICLKGKEDGIYLARELKKIDIPFIFITAISDNNTVNIATKTGAYGYIVKPVDFNQLNIILDVAISQLHCNRRLKLEKQRIESKFREMLDSLQLMMIELDLDFNIKFITKLAKEKYNFNPKIHHSFFDFFSENNKKILSNKLEEVKTGGVKTFNLFINLNDKNYPVFFRCSPILEENEEDINIKGIRILMINIFEIISEFVIPDEDFFNVFSLSEREKEIVKGIIKFQSNQEIAKNLFISLPTVKFHIKNVYSKLKVKNRKELVETLKNYYFKNYGNECYAMYLLNILLNQ